MVRIFLEQLIIIMLTANFLLLQNLGDLEHAKIGHVMISKPTLRRLHTMTFLPGPILRTVTPSHWPSFISSSPGGIRFFESTAVISTISQIKNLQFEPVNCETEISCVSRFTHTWLKDKPKNLNARGKKHLLFNQYNILCNRILI
jgi:hypothetical protein